MRSRYSFYEEAIDDVLGKHPGFLNIKNIDSIFSSSDDDIYYEIPPQHQFRPDLISQKFYSSTKLHWVITFINNIEDAPAGYATGRILRIPNKERVYQAL